MRWLLKYKYLLLIVLVVSAIIAISIAITFNRNNERVIINSEFIYNTWKVEKLYKNGKLVINSNKYNNLFFQVNRDGTGEWHKGEQKIKLNIEISPDGSQMVVDDGMRIEEIETVFELRPTVLRFGKRNINSHYEYVLTAVDLKGGNFITQ
jgi:hypothetical protein